MNKKLAVIILAAGKGTRMKSEMPKVLHGICGRPMLEYVLDLVQGLKADKVIAVLGYKYKEVSKTLKNNIGVVIQKEINGTGSAVKQAMPLLSNFKGTVLVLYGDTPLLKKETIKKLLEHHQKNNFAVTLLTANIEKPKGYGRIIRDKYGVLSKIIEEKDGDEFELDIKEINTGIVCFNKNSLSAALKQIKPDNRKKEYYLTDCIDILYKKNELTGTVVLEDINEALGVNSKVDLAKAYSIIQKRINEKFMEDGVTLVDPASTFVNYGTKIGQDTVIYPFTVIDKNVKIGERCSIGPFIHLREGTSLDNDVTVGNFLEVNRSKLGSKTIAKHFCYIGDALIGRGVNIGAGTVTANFDGKNKNTTVIQDNAFIGSDSILVAPVKVGKGAKTGAGSVLVRNSIIKDGQVVAGVPAKPLKSSR